MQRSGIRYALVYGATGRAARCRGLTGWPVTREALLSVGLSWTDDEVLLVSFFNYVPEAAVFWWPGWNGRACRGDCAGGGDGRRGVVRSRIGLAGALPFDQYRLPAGRVAEVVDLNAACTVLRPDQVSLRRWRRLRRGAAQRCRHRGAARAAAPRGDRS